MKDIKYLVNSDPTAYSVGATALGQSPYREHEERPYKAVETKLTPLEITEFEDDEPSKRGKGLALLSIFTVVSVGLVTMYFNILGSNIDIDIPDIDIADPDDGGTRPGPRRRR